MNYWIYENWTAEKKMVIHLAECGFCNNGKGVHKIKTDKRNGTWHGPFNTLEEAEKIATKPGRKKKYCQVCRPR